MYIINRNKSLTGKNLFHMLHLREAIAQIVCITQNG